MMRSIKDKEFIKLIEDFEPETIRIENIHVHIEESLSIDMRWQSFYFENCIFTGQRIDFYIYQLIEDSFQSLQFINCSISNDLFIKDCKLNIVEFRDVEITSKSLHITTSRIESISITGSSNKHNKIKSIVLNHLKETNLNLDFRLNDIAELYIHECSFNKVMMNANEVNRLTFEEIDCSSYFQFWKNTLKENSIIKKSSFDEFIGKNSTYGAELKFEQVTFKDICRLELVPDKPISSLSFKECTFDKSAYFDDSNFHQLSINGTFFKDIVSFNSTTVSTIKFRSVHFDKVAFFNDFKILLKTLADLGTIRIIKTQLSKTDNKIDYLQYNALEQELLLKDKRTSTSDKILLKLNRKSNYFGNDWIRGVWFTLRMSIYGFIILLIWNGFLNNSGYNYLISFNSKLPNATCQEILREWLKFTFSFDLRSYRNYESHGVLLLIFFFFKIFIGYGVYQTIAAFRKHSK
ncbi:pentapeptide repeat-containing protein [Chryseobacterium lathyri]|uniref:pentapeptide repeat-containing protein n=1 Tax=Chryseobacterium lathyri TaxID=395933 RepID=UPI001CBD4890|nr:pentapeptide repeat-containing protein [Chryseobacterium lathyri]